MSEMLDITAPNLVEIQIRSDGKVIWINVDGACLLRCCRIETLVLNDERRKSSYTCGTCGTHHRSAYITCNHPLCPDGRDQ